MDIRPIDLLNKTFGRKMRGYDPSEVDEFLRAAAEEFENVLKENSDLKQQLETAQQEVSRCRELETTLNNALILGQKTADEVRANAQKEAELVLREARDGAHREFDEIKTRASAMQLEIEEQRKLRERLDAEMRALLQTYMNLLDGGGRGGSTD